MTVSQVEAFTGASDSTQNMSKAQLVNYLNTNSDKWGNVQELSQS